MKVVAFNGSVRNDSNTAMLIQSVFAELNTEGIETELIQFGPNPPHGCVACYKCFDNKDNRCATTKDALNDYVAKMIEADGVILGSPTYFADVTAGMKAFIERAGMVARANPGLFCRKVGAGVVSVRRGGAVRYKRLKRSTTLCSSRR